MLAVSAVASIAYSTGCPCTSFPVTTSRLSMASGGDGSFLHDVVSNASVANPTSGRECNLVTFSKGSDPTVFCYSPNYGMGFCRAWDQLLPPFCAGEQGQPLANPPEWCSAQWCYVDPEQCKRSDISMGKSKIFAGPTFYSYQTCNISSPPRIYTGALSFKPFSTQENLTVTFHSASYFPAVYKLDPMGKAYGQVNDNLISRYLPGDDIERAFLDDSVPPRGALVDFIAKVADSAGIVNIKYEHTTGGATAAAGGSRWSGSTYDVQAGLADLQAADMWITEERLSRVSFTIPIYMDKLHLFVPLPKERSPSFTELLTMQFRPFNGRLWALIIGVVITVGLLKALLNKDEWWPTPDAHAGMAAHLAPPNQSMSHQQQLPSERRSISSPIRLDPRTWGDLRRALSSSASIVDRAGSVLEHQYTSRRSVRCATKGMSEMYLATMNLVQQDVANDAPDLANRVLNMGFAIFALLFSALYTANLVPFLIASQPLYWK